MQLYPQEEYVVARGLEDHVDSSTYYVRAFIRNAKTDALIATLDLTDRGDSHRFSKTWQVPADPTGLGFWISIQTSVYTDAGYTSKAENYGDKYEEKFIEARLRHGGGGADIDYKRVREILRDELAKVPPVAIPPAKDVDFSPLTDALQAILSEVRSIELPEPKAVDFRPVMAKIEALERVIHAIPIPEIDLEPLLAALDELKLTHEPHLADFSAKLDNLFTRIKQFFGNDVDGINEKLDTLKEQLSKIAYVTLPPLKNTDDEE